MSNKGIQYVLDHVIEPALACDELDKSFKDKVKNSRTLFRNFQKSGDMFDYLKRFKDSHGTGNNELYDAFKALGLKTFEDIYDEVIMKFKHELNDVTVLDDFIIGEKYTSYDIAIFTKVYNVQKGIYLVGDEPNYQAIFIKVTLQSGEYPNKWIIPGKELKYYMYAPKDRYDPNYKFNKAIINSADIPIYVFIKEGTVCKLEGIFEYVEYITEENNRKWFRLKKKGLNTLDGLITTEQYNKEIAEDIKTVQQIDEELSIEGELLDKKRIISQFTKDLLHQKGFLLDHSDNTYIRFSTEKLDSIVGFLGEGWSKQIERLLLFEIGNKSDNYTLRLIIGPGNQEIRNELYTKAKENPDLYNIYRNHLSDQFTTIYSKKFLTHEQLSSNPLEQLKQQIEASLEEFIKCDLNPLCDGLRSKQQIDLETQLLDIIHNDMFDEIEETEKLTYIKARIGHSKLREVLIKKDGCCKICGLSDERFLIASHIKPWSKSNNQERLDLNNVLLLCPHHDAAFDKGYITFDESGIIRISSELSIETRLLLNLNSEKKIELTEKQREYIRWHEESIFHN